MYVVHRNPRPVSPLCFYILHITVLASAYYDTHHESGGVYLLAIDGTEHTGVLRLAAGSTCTCTTGVVA